jgi:CRP-like cAMP-binding protein
MSKPSRQLIQGVSLFAELDDATADRLAEDFVQRDFAAGTAIATEGSGGLNFFVVESGEASVTVNGEQVATLGPGASFGEVALVDKEARTATVTASTEMRTYALPVWSFRSFVETRPAVTWRLLEILADRLRASEARHRR